MCAIPIARSAQPRSEGAQKPKSELAFELAEAPVRTFAHWIPYPRQTFEDVEGLGALIDGELLYGLQLVEDGQIISGDGTDQNLMGLIPQPPPYAPAFAVTHENALDRIPLAIVQAQQARLPVDGVLINDVTWAQLISLKDSERRYLAGPGGGPSGRRRACCGRCASCRRPRCNWTNVWWGHSAFARACTIAWRPKCWCRTRTASTSSRTC